MELVIYLISTFGLAGFFIWLIADLLVFHQDRGERVAAWIAKLFAWTGKKAEKVATAMSVQSKIDGFASAIDSEVRGLLPYSLKVKWISPEMTREVFIKNNSVVVMLSYHTNQDENLSKATALYMSKAVIPEARPHIDKHLSAAIDLMMTKKALYSFIEARSALDHFVTSILRPQMSTDGDVKEFCESIESTDERGLFTRILLRELLELGRRRAGHTESGDSVFESTQFVKHLKIIAEKEAGKDVDPNFLHNDIRMAIIFIARPEKVNYGIDQYVKAIDKYGIQKNARVIYIFCRGQKNLKFAKNVVKESQSRFGSLALTHEEEFVTKTASGTILPSYCAIFYNRKAL